MIHAVVLAVLLTPIVLAPIVVVLSLAWHATPAAARAARRRAAAALAGRRANAVDEENASVTAAGDPMTRGRPGPICTDPRSLRLLHRQVVDELAAHAPLVDDE